MKAPFPWFGGKRRVAPVVWRAFGDTANYVEPFCGSLAVLLERPADHVRKIETVNDRDGFISNFWRAIQSDPEAVARWADWPVSENDLHARHAWLLAQSDRLVARLEGDPDYYDAKIAGWWVWGICSWIGSGWCRGIGPWHVVDGELVNTRTEGGVNRQLPHLGNAGMGVNRQLPHLGDAGMGVNRQLPHLGNAGMGVNRQLPHLGNAGRGVNRQLPHLGNAGRGHVAEWFAALSDRLRGVRICSGDWTRVTGSSVTHRHGLTGVFLDPPYLTQGRDSTLYRHESDVAHDVAAWAIEQGDNPLMRIALCGYEGEHDMPETWAVHRWKAAGGFGSQANGTGRENAKRETIWFSPHCLPIGSTGATSVEQPALALTGS